MNGRFHGECAVAGVQSASPRAFRTLASPTASPLAISSWPEAGLDRSHHCHPRRHPNPSRSRSARDDDPRPGGWRRTAGTLADGPVQQ